MGKRVDEYGYPVCWEKLLFCNDCKREVNHIVTDDDQSCVACCRVVTKRQRKAGGEG